MAGSTVGSEASVVGSIVGQAAEVGAGARVIDGSVIGHREKVASGTEIAGATVPDPSTWQ
ncbi:MAG TPA: hypothetical protein PLV93_11170, partial [Microthrixaceae bacterium]|nr:hypothetical protein [Microthrixaceae bacterium]